MIDFSFENLSDCVFHHAAQTPRAPALHEGHQTLSYGGLAALVRQAAVYLTGHGIKAQDRVGIALTNSIERVALALALMRIGAVGIELPEDITAPTLAAFVGRYGMDATLVEPNGPASPAKTALIIPVQWRASLASLTGDPRYEGDPAQLRLINLSSGSTGFPKGLVSAHQHRLVRSHMTLNTAAFYAPAQKGPLLLAAPASTNLVWGMLLNHLILGGPIVLIPAYRHMIDLVREVASWDEVIFPVPPGIARQMLPYAPKDALLFPRMRALITAGQAIAGHDKLALTQKLTPDIYEFYGSGGIGMLTCIGPDEVAKQLKSVGKPASYPGVEVEIAGPDGRRLTQGSIGQLRVRGPNTAIGFVNPEDNERGTERFIDGWYYPGEVASLNKAGYLILEGRIADAIHTPTQIIYPPEIEDAISQHADVAEVAIVGRAGPQGGEDIVAFIVARPGFAHQDIVAHCRKKLSASKRPKFIYYLDNMPRTGNGKIDRTALKTAPLKRIDPI
jgi:acyl-CoA synthetase (AMP-forming)/AMP-acid ligase II